MIINELRVLRIVCVDRIDIPWRVPVLVCSGRNCRWSVQRSCQSLCTVGPPDGSPEEEEEEEEEVETILVILFHGF